MAILVVFIVYLVVLACIGAYCARFNRTLADFVLGGRRLGAWVAALSAQASDMSAWLLIGLPAAAYAKGLSALWIAVGCAVGTVFNWMVVAPRLRRETARCGALTIPDYLASRYGEGRLRLVRVLSVAVILLAYATYIASQFIAAGKTFETTFAEVALPWGLGRPSYHAGMLLGVGIILLYTAAGGFTAVAWTDLVQGLLMVATVIVLPLVGLVGLGGLPVLWSKLHAANPHFLGLAGAEGAGGLGFVMGVVVANLSWGLGYPGQPHILVRFMALRDPRAMRRATFIGITWVLLAMWGAVFVGLVGRAVLGGLDDRDCVMPALALHLVHPALAGVMIAAAIAAMMSTVDSQLLVAASAVEEDIYIRFLGGRPRDRGAVWIGRITVLALGAAALPIAWGRRDVLKTVFDAWGMLGAGLGPAVLLGLLWRRASRWGAAVGMLAGALTVQFWGRLQALAEHGFQEGLLPGSVHETVKVLPALVPGFLLSLALTWVVSLLTGGSRARGE